MTRTPTDTERQTAAILHDAITLSATITAALRGLDDGASVFPASTPGANPEEATVVPEAPPADGDDDDDRGPTSQTERAALFGHDPARLARAELAKAMDAAEVALRRAAGLALRWGRPALGDSTIAERLSAIDRDIWCSNCSKHGHRNPRAKGRTVCEWCAQFRADWKTDAPKEVLDLRASKGRLYEADIRRTLERLDAEQKARKRGTKITA